MGLRTPGPQASSVSPGAHCLGSDPARGMLWGLRQWSRETNGKGRGGAPALPWGIVGSESATWGLRNLAGVKLLLGGYWRVSQGGDLATNLMAPKTPGP